jgi:hydroxymethylpyrimidine/phosphomethylpyrimidine kinase
MAIPLAETVQNGLACTRILPPSVDPVIRLESLGPHLAGSWGVKVGLCALELPVLRRLLGVLDQLNPTVRIWDPILAPSAGVGCHTPEELQTMADAVLKSGHWIVCPNRGEAAALAGLPPERIREATPQELSQPLMDRGAKAVWLKGGHTGGATVQDLWITAQGIETMEAVPRLPGDRRGTGCFLSAAWLGLRLRGLDEVASARQSAHLLRARWERAASPGGLGRPCLLPEGA